MSKRCCSDTNPLSFALNRDLTRNRIRQNLWRVVLVCKREKARRQSASELASTLTAAAFPRRLNLQDTICQKLSLRRWEGGGGSRHLSGVQRKSDAMMRMRMREDITGGEGGTHMCLSDVRWTPNPIGCRSAWQKFLSILRHDKAQRGTRATRCSCGSKQLSNPHQFISTFISTP